MPVPAQPRVNRHTGNGVTDTWAYGFRILKKLDIGVDVDGALLTVDVDYTVTDVGEANGGTIVFVVPPANLAKITLYSNAAYARIRFDYVRNGSFKEETVDADFDQTIILVQQLDERFGRGLNIPISDANGTNVELPSETERAGMLLGFDSVGNVVALAPADLDITMVSAFMSTLLDDPDAAAARDTLGALATDGGNLSGAINGNRISVTGHATDTPIWAGDGDGTANAVAITGTPTITDFPDAPQAGAVRRIFPAAGTIITDNSNIAVQGGLNYTFETGDWALIEAITTSTFMATLFKASGNAVPRGLFSKLVSSANGTSANISITADQIALQSPSGSTIIRSAFSATINTATTGKNGLSTGVLAGATKYARFAGFDGTNDCGWIDPSRSSPTVPSGVTHYAFVGWVYTDGTANKYPLGFTQRGRIVKYRVQASTNVPNLPILASGAAGSALTPTWVSVAFTGYAPDDAANILFTLGSSTTSGELILAPNNNYSGRQSSGNPPPVVVIGNSAINGVGAQVQITPESTNVFWASATSGGYLACAGWEENL